MVGKLNRLQSNPRSITADALLGHSARLSVPGDGYEDSKEEMNRKLWEESERLVFRSEVIYRFLTDVSRKQLYF